MERRACLVVCGARMMRRWRRDGCRHSEDPRAAASRGARGSRTSSWNSRSRASVSRSVATSSSR
eukprot:7189095-Prymnesium_polylepis.1